MEDDVNNTVPGGASLNDITHIDDDWEETFKPIILSRMVKQAQAILDYARHNLEDDCGERYFKYLNN